MAANVTVDQMTSSVRADAVGPPSPERIVAAVLEAMREESEHRARIHAERWIPCCADCAEEAEEAR